MNRNIETKIGFIVIGVVSVLSLVAVHYAQNSSELTETLTISSVPSQNQVYAQEVNTIGITVDPSANSVAVGSEFPVAIRAMSSTPVNAVQATITYPSDKLTLVSINTAGTAFDIGAEENITAGTISLIRGTTTPKTGNLLVATALFKAKAAGTASVLVTNDSKLVSSQSNTDILQTTGSGTYTIQSLVNPTIAITATPTRLPSPTPTKTVILSPTPIVANTFRGEYFDNKTLSGTPILTRFDNAINFDWGSLSPSMNIPKDRFSVRWTKTENFAGGNYKFTVKSDDGLRIKIDGQTVFNNWKDQSARTKTFSKAIPAGDHTIVVEYYENRGKAVSQVSWQRI